MHAGMAWARPSLSSDSRWAAVPQPHAICFSPDSSEPFLLIPCMVRVCICARVRVRACFLPCSLGSDQDSRDSRLPVVWMQCFIMATLRLYSSPLFSDRLQSSIFILKANVAPKCWLGDRNITVMLNHCPSLWFYLNPYASHRTKQQRLAWSFRRLCTPLFDFSSDLSAVAAWNQNHLQCLFFTWRVWANIKRTISTARWNEQ